MLDCVLNAQPFMLACHPGAPLPQLTDICMGQCLITIIIIVIIEHAAHGALVDSASITQQLDAPLQLMGWIAVYKLHHGSETMPCPSKPPTQACSVLATPSLAVAISILISSMIGQVAEVVTR